MGSLVSTSSSRMLACSSRMPSGLFTSWAMPAASCPMLASFSDLTRASLVLSSERCESSRSPTVVDSFSITNCRHIVSSAMPW